jgi:hypothetical protein
MNEAAVRLVIGSKIADGTLPRDNIGLVSSSTYGLDQVCDACSESVSPQQILYKLTRAGSDGFVFHSGCFAIWRAERKSMLSVGAGVLD